MEILTVEVGLTLLAFPAEQVEEIHNWPRAVEFPVVDVRAALGIGNSGAYPESRVMVARGSEGGQAGFVIPSTVRQRSAKGMLVKVPRVLSALDSPRWLAGFAVLDEKLAVLIDLQALAARILGPTSGTV
jgi:chemotaxis signal transduction protein